MTHGRHRHKDLSGRLAHLFPQAGVLSNLVPRDSCRLRQRQNAPNIVQSCSVKVANGWCHARWGRKSIWNKYMHKIHPDSPSRWHERHAVLVGMVTCSFSCLFSSRSHSRWCFLRIQVPVRTKFRKETPIEDVGIPVILKNRHRKKPVILHVHSTL